MAKPRGRDSAKPPAAGGSGQRVAKATEDGDAKPAGKQAGRPVVRKPAPPRGKPAPTKRTTPSPSSRYTPPIPKSEKVSPIWVPIIMFGCLGIGMAMIILNYVNVLPGPEPSNVYLMVGLGLITAGFITATRYH